MTVMLWIYRDAGSMARTLHHVEADVGSSLATMVLTNFIDLHYPYVLSFEQFKMSLSYLKLLNIFLAAIHQTI